MDVLKARYTAGAAETTDPFFPASYGIALALPDALDSFCERLR